MIVTDLGLIDFHEAHAIQEEQAFAVAAGCGEETLFLMEHTPVFTTGSGGSDANILDPSIRPVRVNRGGDVTYHGPGQLVGYPVIDLNRRGKDLHRYLRFLEELIIGIASEFGVSARRISGKTGVWTGSLHAPAKLASIGVGVRRWVTMHGFALNVENDLSHFSRINPCGIIGCPVTSMARERPGALPMDLVKEKVSPLFELLMNDLLPVGPGDIIVT